MGTGPAPMKSPARRSARVQQPYYSWAGKPCESAALNGTPRIRIVGFERGCPDLRTARQQVRFLPGAPVFVFEAIRTAVRLGSSLLQFYYSSGPTTALRVTAI